MAVDPEDLWRSLDVRNDHVLFGIQLRGLPFHGWNDEGLLPGDRSRRDWRSIMKFAHFCISFFQVELNGAAVFRSLVQQIKRLTKE